MSRTDDTKVEGDDSVYRDALEVLILTAMIAKDARQDAEQRLKGFGADITAPQYRLLRQLQQVGSSTIKDLSGVMMVGPATLVPMVDTLERHGFIRRGVDPNDRRRTPLELTESGQQRLDAVPFIHTDDPIARFLRELPEDERQSFLRHLRSLAEALHSASHGVRHISDAVNAYFDFGQLSTEQRTPRGHAQRTRRSHPHEQRHD